MSKDIGAREGPECRSRCFFRRLREHAAESEIHRKKSARKEKNPPLCPLRLPPGAEREPSIFREQRKSLLPDSRNGIRPERAAGRMFPPGTGRRRPDDAHARGRQRSPLLRSSSSPAAAGITCADSAEQKSEMTNFMNLSPSEGGMSGSASRKGVQYAVLDDLVSGSTSSFVQKEINYGVTRPAERSFAYEGTTVLTASTFVSTRGIICVSWGRTAREKHAIKRSVASQKALSGESYRRRLKATEIAICRSRRRRKGYSGQRKRGVLSGGSHPGIHRFVFFYSKARQAGGTEQSASAGTRRSETLLPRSSGGQHSASCLRGHCARQKCLHG